MTDREIELAMDKLIGRVWDEGRCRVCGKDFRNDHRKNGECIFVRGGGVRADDPLPHTTSWEQIARDREKLPEDKHEAFMCALEEVMREAQPEAYTEHLHISPYGKFAWLQFNATPRQQSIAWLRAHGVEVEG